MQKLPCKHNCQLLESSVSTLQISAICVLFPVKNLFCLEIRGCDSSFLEKNNQSSRTPPKNIVVAVSATDRPDRRYVSVVYTQCKVLGVVCRSILTMFSSVQKYVYTQCWMESWMQTAVGRSYIPIAVCGFSELLRSANCSSYSLYLSGTDG